MFSQCKPRLVDQIPHRKETPTESLMVAKIIIQRLAPSSVVADHVILFMTTLYRLVKTISSRITVN